MDNSPVTTGERLEWMAKHCDKFQFQMTTTGYFIIAHKGDDKYYESAGPLDNVHEAVDDAFYQVIQNEKV